MSIILALALFGCSDDGSYCRRVGGDVETFASAAECQAATPAALNGFIAGADEYPVVQAQCLPAATLASLGDHAVDLTRPQVQLARR